MGLLGNGFDDPRSAANMALAAGLLRGDLGAGLLGSNNAYAQAKNDAFKQQYLQAQIAETQAQAQERQAQTKKLQDAMEQQARMRQAIPGLFQQPGMTGGQPAPQAEGGIPMFSKPMGVTPTQSTPGGFNVQEAIRLGMDPETIQKYAGLQNVGRPKVARTVKGMGPDGKEYEYQVDEFGQRVGDGMAQYRAPISVNQGNQTTFADPYSLKPVGGFKTFQSPDSAASTAVAMRGQNMTDARARETNALGHVPAGYRQNATGGLEFIPGGPADPNAAKRAAPTEFQGKSATYGARALEADKIISSLEGKYSPGAVNAKVGMESVPGIGGFLGAGANAALSDSGQKAEQAQRDFVNAVLRQESGAAISSGEFDNARKQYFPQPFDSAAVKVQKARNRQIAIQGFLANARPGSVDAIAGGGSGGATGGWAIREVK